MLNCLKDKTELLSTSQFGEKNKIEKSENITNNFFMSRNCQKIKLNGMMNTDFTI